MKKFEPLLVLLVIISTIAIIECHYSPLSEDFLREHSTFARTPNAHPNMTWIVNPAAWRPLHLEFVGNEFAYRGFTRLPPDSKDYNASWLIFLPPANFSGLSFNQRVNNFPEVRHMFRKDLLHNIVHECLSVHPGTDDYFTFWPDTYDLASPFQFNLFRKIYIEHEKNNPGKPGPIYIIKRSFMQRGEGVHLVATLADVDFMQNQSSSCFPLYKTRPIAQKYVMDVLTLAGYKVTLRVYALLSSVDPMRLWVYPEGLVRVCSKKYTTEESSLGDLFTHVDSIDINYVNEENKEFEADMKREGIEHEGLRVSIIYLLEHLAKKGHDSRKLWEDMMHLILMSVVASEPHLVHGYNQLCGATEQRGNRLNPLELFGYDILIDESMKVHLLEINSNPSLAPHTNMENHVKANCVREAFNLVDMGSSWRATADEETERIWEAIKNLPASHLIASKLERGVLGDKEVIRGIVEYEHEFPNKGSFTPAFPRPGGQHYLKFFTSGRSWALQRWVDSGLKLSDLPKAPWSSVERARAMSNQAYKLNQERKNVQ